jgi:Tetracyclin repressor-like, C-terminal domain
VDTTRLSASPGDGRAGPPAMADKPLVQHTRDSRNALACHHKLRPARGSFISEIVIPALSSAAPGRARLLALCEGYLSYIHRRVFPGGCFFVAAAELGAVPGPSTTSSPATSGNGATCSSTRPAKPMTEASYPAATRATRLRARRHPRRHQHRRRPPLRRQRPRARPAPCQLPARASYQHWPPATLYSSSLSAHIDLICMPGGTRIRHVGAAHKMPCIGSWTC